MGEREKAPLRVAGAEADPAPSTLGDGVKRLQRLVADTGRSAHGSRKARKRSRAMGGQHHGGGEPAAGDTRTDKMAEGSGEKQHGNDRDADLSTAPRCGWNIRSTAKTAVTNGTATP